MPDFRDDVTVSGGGLLMASAPAVGDIAAGHNLNQVGVTIPTSAAVSFTGSPNIVLVAANVHGALPDNVAVARAAVVVELWRANNGGATSEMLATAATGYIRDANDHEEASWHFAYWDVAPGVDPEYSLVTRRDSTLTGAVPSVAPSSLRAVAWTAT